MIRRLLEGVPRRGLVLLALLLAFLLVFRNKSVQEQQPVTRQRFRILAQPPHRILQAVSEEAMAQRVEPGPRVALGGAPGLDGFLQIGLAGGVAALGRTIGGAGFHQISAARRERPLGHPVGAAGRGSGNVLHGLHI